MIWWLLLIFCIVLWLPQNIIHEGSHALMGKCFGLEIVKFRIFPEVIDKKFYFAYVRFGTTFTNISKTKERLILMAPAMVNSFFIVLGFVLMFFTKLELIYAFMLVNLVDICANGLVGYVIRSHGTDFGRVFEMNWKHKMLVSLWILNLMALTTIGLFS